MRAEIISRPTEAMWEAMKSTEIDWYVNGQDPSVAELQDRMAEMTGKEAALFTVTGALANISGLLSLAERGSQVIMERRCHIYWAEGNNAAYVANIATRLLDGDRFGRMTPEQVDAAFREADYGYAQSTSLLCLENTHNVAGGCALSPAETAALAEVAKGHGAKVFLDGARLWNAAAYHGASLAEMLKGVDGAMVSLNKGLGAPVGAVLVGSAETIQKAQLAIRRLGSSGVHRMGYFAAAALCALDTMQGTFAEDHRRARRLAEGLSEIEGLHVDLETVQTNIVRVEILTQAVDAFEFADRLRAHGVGCRVIEAPNVVKFHTYWEIDDDAIEQTVAAVQAVVDEL
jgi:threonine aldolase